MAEFHTRTGRQRRYREIKSVMQIVVIGAVLVGVAIGWLIFH